MDHKYLHRGSWAGSHGERRKAFESISDKSVEDERRVVPRKFDEIRNPSSSSSSSDTDSDGSSASSYEYEWREAESVVQPTPTIVNFGGSALPGIQREFEKLLPLKTVLVILFPNNTPEDLKGEIDELLEIRTLTRKEAKMLTDFLKSLHEKDVRSVTVGNDIYVTQYQAGERACTVNSLKAKYDSILDSLYVAATQSSNGIDTTKVVGKPQITIPLKTCVTNNHIMSVKSFIRPHAALKKRKSKTTVAPDTAEPSLEPSTVSVAGKAGNPDLSPPVSVSVTGSSYLFPSAKAILDSPPCQNADDVDADVEISSNESSVRPKISEKPARKKTDLSAKKNVVILKHLFPENEEQEEDGESDHEKEEKNSSSDRKEAPSPPRKNLEKFRKRKTSKDATGASNRVAALIESSSNPDTHSDEHSMDSWTSMLSTELLASKKSSVDKDGAISAEGVDENNNIASDLRSTPLRVYVRTTSEDDAGHVTRSIVLDGVPGETVPSKMPDALLTADKSPKITFSMDASPGCLNSYDAAFNGAARKGESERTKRIKRPNENSSVSGRQRQADSLRRSDSPRLLRISPQHGAKHRIPYEKDGGIAVVLPKDGRDRSRHSSVTRPSPAALQRKEQNRLIMRSHRCLQNRDRRERERVVGHDRSRSREYHRSSNEREKRRDNSDRGSRVHRSPQKRPSAEKARDSKSRTPPHDSRNRDSRSSRDGSAGRRSSSKDSQSSHRELEGKYHRHESQARQKNFVMYAPGRDYPICPDYSKMQYKYSADLYSSLSSSEADFGDDENEAEDGPKRRILLSKASRDENRLRGTDRARSPREKPREEPRERRRDEDFRRAPVNVERVDSLVPDIAANIEHLVVSIRQNCASRRVGRDSPHRGTSDLTRRRSHSPSCARSLSPPDSSRNRRRARRRSLSPVYYEPDPGWRRDAEQRDSRREYEKLSPDRRTTQRTCSTGRAMTHGTHTVHPPEQFPIQSILGTKGVAENQAEASFFEQPDYLRGDNASQNHSFAAFERIWAHNEAGNTRLSLRHANYTADVPVIVSAGVDCVGNANMITANIPEQAVRYDYEASFRPVQGTSMHVPHGHFAFGSGGAGEIGWPVQRPYNTSAAIQFSPRHDNEQQVIILKGDDVGKDQARDEEDWPFMPNKDSCESSNDSCDGEVESLMTSRISSLFKNKKNSGSLRLPKKSIHRAAIAKGPVSDAASKGETAEQNRIVGAEATAEQTSKPQNEEVDATRKLDSSALETDIKNGSKIICDVNSKPAEIQPTDSTSSPALQIADSEDGSNLPSTSVHLPTNVVKSKDTQNDEVPEALQNSESPQLKLSSQVSQPTQNVTEIKARNEDAPGACNTELEKTVLEEDTVCNKIEKHAAAVSVEDEPKVSEPEKSAPGVAETNASTSLPVVDKSNDPTENTPTGKSSEGEQSDNSNTNSRDFEIVAEASKCQTIVCDDGSAELSVGQKERKTDDSDNGGELPKTVGDSNVVQDRISPVPIPITCLLSSGIGEKATTETANSVVDLPVLGAVASTKDTDPSPTPVSRDPRSWKKILLHKAQSTSSEKAESVEETRGILLDQSDKQQAPHVAGSIEKSACDNELEQPVLLKGASSTAPVNNSKVTVEADVFPVLLPEKQPINNPEVKHINQEPPAPKAVEPSVNDVPNSDLNKPEVKQPNQEPQPPKAVEPGVNDVSNSGLNKPEVKHPNQEPQPPKALETSIQQAPTAETRSLSLGEDATTVPPGKSSLSTGDKGVESSSDLAMQTVTSYTTESSSTSTPVTVLSNIPTICPKLNVSTPKLGSISSDRIFSVVTRPTAITISTSAVPERAWSPRPTGALASRSNFRGPQARKIKGVEKTPRVVAKSVVSEPGLGRDPRKVRSASSSSSEVVHNPIHKPSSTPVGAVANTILPGSPNKTAPKIFGGSGRSTPKLPPAAAYAPTVNLEEHHDSISPPYDSASNSDLVCEPQDIGDALDLDRESDNTNRLSSVKLARYSGAPKPHAPIEDDALVARSVLDQRTTVETRLADPAGRAGFSSHAPTAKPLKSILHRPVPTTTASTVDVTPPLETSQLTRLETRNTPTDLSFSDALKSSHEKNDKIASRRTGTKRKRGTGQRTTASAKAKKSNNLSSTSSRGRGRGRRGGGGKGRNSKRRKRLPSLSSDDDLIEELSAATTVTTDSKEKTQKPVQQDVFSDTDEDDSDDGLVSFMEIGDFEKKTEKSETSDGEPGPNDTEGETPVADDHTGSELSTSFADDKDDETAIKQENDDTDSEDLPVISLSEQHSHEYNAADHDSVQQESDQPDSSDIRENYPVKSIDAEEQDNIFTKMSREMEADNAPLKDEFNSNSIELSEDTHTKEEQTQQETIGSNFVKDAEQNTDDYGEYEVNENPLQAAQQQISHPAPDHTTASNPFPPGNSFKLAGNQRRMDIGPADIEQPLLLTPPLSPKSSNSNASCSGIATEATLTASEESENYDLPPIAVRVGKSDSGINRKQSRRPAIEDVDEWRMPEGENCHGFLEVCMAVPNDKIYSLRRIPYVKTTSKAEPDVSTLSGMQWGQKATLHFGESSAGSTHVHLLPTSSACATYLRLRDVISLLKLQPDVLSSLTSRCCVKLSLPNEFTHRLFSTVYDPVCTNDPVMNRLTMRNKPGKRVQAFLDKMIILDEFLHNLLPRFYLEALDVKSFDVPKFVNVKIFKPISNIDEEVVKIFRKPYEYNGILQGKDDKVKCRSLKRRSGTATKPGQQPVRPASIGTELPAKRRKPAAAVTAITRPWISTPPPTSYLSTVTLTRPPLDAQHQGLYLSRHPNAGALVRGPPPRHLQAPANTNFATSPSPVQGLYGVARFHPPRTANVRPSIPNAVTTGGPPPGPYAYLPMNLSPNTRAVTNSTVAVDLRLPPYAPNVARSTVIQSTGLPTSYVSTPFEYRNVSAAPLAYRLATVSNPMMRNFVSNSALGTGVPASMMPISGRPTLPPRHFSADMTVNRSALPHVRDLSVAAAPTSEPDFTITSVFSLKNGPGAKPNDNIDQYSDITEDSSDDEVVQGNPPAKSSTNLLTTKEFLQNAAKVLSEKSRIDKTEGETGLVQKLRSRNTMLKTGLTDAADILPEIAPTSKADRSDEMYAISTESATTRLKGNTVEPRKDAKLIKDLMPKTDTAETGHLSGIVSKLQSRVQDAGTKPSKGRGRKKGTTGAKKTKGKQKDKQVTVCEKETT